MTYIVDVVKFETNYIWILKKEKQIIVIDPGQSTPVLNYIKKNSMTLSQILLTHYHSDHIAGLPELVSPLISVVGPVYEPIQYMTKPVRMNDEITVFDSTLKVLFVPGHTAGHIAYLGDGNLFCGDVIFGGGCGRIFEGDAETMYYSVKKCAQCHPDTKVYCGHEYTLDNLRFALTLEPNNEAIKQRIVDTTQLLKKSKMSMPSTIGLELQTNPFMRCDQSTIINAAENYVKRELKSDIDVFSVIRHWKNVFK